MDRAFSNLIAAAAAPIIAALVTYIIAKRKTSGKIITSEAAQLWQESQNMRQELRDEVKELRTIINELRLRIKELEDEKVVDKAKIAELIEKVKILEGKVKELESKL